MVTRLVLYAQLWLRSFACSQVRARTEISCYRSVCGFRVMSQSVCSRVRSHIHMTSSDPEGLSVTSPEKPGVDVTAVGLAGWRRRGEVGGPC